MIDGLASFFVRTEAPGRLYWMTVALILAVGYWRREQALTGSAVNPTEVPVDPGSTGNAGRWLPARENLLR
jgi:hypothetical protein